MGRRIRPLMLHKNEWQRLHDQANPHKTPAEPSCKVDLQGMIEQSQRWTSNWPDSVQNHVKKVKMEKKKRYPEEVATVETFKHRTKQENTAKAIKLARAMIFEKTGYGRQLMSAIAESKANEERDIQIKFKEELKEKEKLLQEEANHDVRKNAMYKAFEKTEMNRLVLKQREIENAQFNQAIAKMKKEDAFKAAKIEKMHRLEDAKMIEQLRQLEILEQKRNICYNKEDVLKYDAETKMIRERRAKREQLDLALAGVWNNYHDRIRCREREIHDHIHKEKHSTQSFRDNYEIVRRIQAEEEKKYNNFIEKGVALCKKRLEKREKEAELQKQRQKQMNAAEARSNKEYCEGLRAEQACLKQSICDKQSFVPGPTTETKTRKVPKVKGPKREPPTYTSLKESLQRREATPSGWSGTAQAHAQFAQAASAALAECRYTTPVRKVIQEYRKTNLVEDLPIPHS